MKMKSFFYFCLGFALVTALMTAPYAYSYDCRALLYVDQGYSPGEAWTYASVSFTDSTITPGGKAVTAGGFQTTYMYLYVGDYGQGWVYTSVSTGTTRMLSGVLSGTENAYQGTGWNDTTSMPSTCEPPPPPECEEGEILTGTTTAKGLNATPVVCVEQCEYDTQTGISMFNKDESDEWQSHYYEVVGTGESCEESEEEGVVHNPDSPMPEALGGAPYPVVEDDGTYKPDQDADGIPSDVDPDVDGDGKGNQVDGDADGDGEGNGTDNDVDGDGTSNGGGTGDWTYTSPAPSGNGGIGADPDVDGDSIPNGGDANVDGDKYGNGDDGDIDGDGVPNPSDGDADGDGIPNESDDEPNGVGGGWGDGTGGTGDTSDMDGNGVPDNEEEETGEEDDESCVGEDCPEYPELDEYEPTECPEGEVCIGDGVCQEGEVLTSSDCVSDDYINTRFAEFKETMSTTGPFAIVSAMSGPTGSGSSSFSFDSGDTFGGQRDFDFSMYDSVWWILNGVVSLIACYGGIKIIVLKG